MGIDEFIYDVVRGGIRAASADIFTRLIDNFKNKKTPPKGRQNRGGAFKKTNK